MTRCWPVGAALGLMGAVYLVVYRLDAAAPLGPLRNLAATLAASVPFALAVWASCRPGAAALSPWVVVLGTVALHLCVPLDLLCGTDDAYRYMWDGRVLAHGINPYRHAPDAAALAWLREPVFHPNIYRPDMRTVYPPLAELWFWVSHRLSPASFAGLKGVLLAHQLAAALLLTRLIRRTGGRGSALVYAWSPLAVVQLMAGAHLDGLMVPWLLLALLAAERSPGWAGAALGSAALVRPTAALCLPALMARRPLREAGAAGVGALTVAVALLLPFARAGAGLYESLFVYARRWRFNGSLFRAVELVLGRGLTARVTTYGAVGAAALGSAWLRASLHARWLLAMGAYVALAPTVYPWYLVPLVALGALAGGPLFVALPAVVGISDLVYVEKLTTGRWQVPPVALAAEYGAIAALLLRETVVRLRRRRG